MYRSKHIVTHDIHGNYDCILIVITFPRHISHFQVSSQCQFSVFGRITFRQDLTFFHALSLLHDRAQSHGRTLVGTFIFRQQIFFRIAVEAYETFFFCLVVFNHDTTSVHEIDHTRSFGNHLCTGILDQVSFQPGSYDRSLRFNDRYSLAHHVRSHQGTVGIVVFQERNQRSRDRGNLVRGNIDQIDLFHFFHREVTVFTRFRPLVHKMAFTIYFRVSLCDHQSFFFFG